MNTTSRLTRILAATAACGLLGVSLAGCSVVKSLVHQDAWAVTYEVTLDGTEPGELTGISYEAQALRGEELETVAADDITTNSWTQDAIVEVNTHSMITAMAPEGRTASCRILLDDTRVIAEETGEPGGSVTCETVTPSFDK